MRKTRYAMAALAALLLSGCIPSLYPVYKDEDLIFDAELLGDWAGKPDSSEHWQFTEAGAKTYNLVLTDDQGTTGGFVAHLAEFRGAMFLDLFPQEPVCAGSDFYKSHLMPVHTFYLIEQTSASIRLSCVNPDWLKKHLEQRPNSLGHEWIGDRLVLTARTEELQSFLLFDCPKDEAYTELTNLTRKAVKR